jgi:hypothetical protein
LFAIGLRSICDFSCVEKPDNLKIFFSIFEGYLHALERRKNSGFLPPSIKVVVRAPP